MTAELHVDLEVRDVTGISPSEQLAVLRGQLTLIRRRVETGIPVSVETIARAERLAHNLELLEVAA
jgi:hypothetical protein